MENTTQKKQKTVKVRIAVAVDYEGHYSAAGWSNASRQDAMEMATSGDSISGGYKQVWVEIEVPIPQATLYTGAVQIEDGEIVEEGE